MCAHRSRATRAGRAGGRGLQFFGRGLAQRYGLQFRKVIAYVRSQYLPRAPAEARAAAVRLDLVIESFERGEGLPSKLVEDQPAELDAAWETVTALFRRPM